MYKRIYFPVIIKTKFNIFHVCYFDNLLIIRFVCFLNKKLFCFNINHDLFILPLFLAYNIYKKERVELSSSRS